MAPMAMGKASLLPEVYIRAAVSGELTYMCHVLGHSPVYEPETFEGRQPKNGRSLSFLFPSQSIVL